MNVTQLTKFVVSLLVMFPVIFLWLSVVSLLVHPFGLRLPLTPFRWAEHRSAFQAFTFPQYLMVGGILYFSCGMLITSTVQGYLEWKCWHGSPLTSENMVREILGSLLAGVLMGFLSWSPRGNSAK